MVLFDSSDTAFISLYYLLQSSIINWNKLPSNYSKEICLSNILLKRIALAIKVIQDLIKWENLDSRIIWQS